MFTGIILLLASATMELPAVSDKAPIEITHFPTRAHAFVWRNWPLVPLERMAEVLRADPAELRRAGEAMGLGVPPVISDDVRSRAYITIIRRNWHLLPYEQLTQLLGMSDEQLAFTLREDDFLYIKLGSLKPRCEPLRLTVPNDATLAREREIRAVVEKAFPMGPMHAEEPLFRFIQDLSAPLEDAPARPESRFSPRYCSSYFALFGDPLLDIDLDPFPDGYLQRLAASGVDSVWMHAVLYHLAPFPWAPGHSARHETRLENLRALTERLDRHGIGLFLYVNEPRAMQQAFFDTRPELKGVSEGDFAALCTSTPEVRDFLRDSVALVCKAAPKLRGFFTITASENLTSCWSHHRGADCPRCSQRTPASVIAEVNATVWEGIQAAESSAELIAWDWGWRDDWAVEAINALPDGVAHMSVSEWSIPISRGGIDTTVGEYSISTIGPGPRATKHWAAARARGLKTVAKIQAGNTWELSAVPYIPAVENVAQHAANLRESGVGGIMLGWSLGGYPSPNLAVVAEMAGPDAPSIGEAMHNVATARYGDKNADAVVSAWQTGSAALKEFPYHGSVVYRAPLQMGPANPLWAEDTGYVSTMVGIPYDDLKGWRGPYPEDVFAQQLTLMASGFQDALDGLLTATSDRLNDALQGEINVIEATQLHYASVASQVRFVQARNALEAAAGEKRAATVSALETLLRAERDRAIRLHAVQRRDSRIGYEASNHYFYVPVDLAEKVLNCEHLLQSWLPGMSSQE